MNVLLYVETCGWPIRSTKVNDGNGYWTECPDAVHKVHHFVYIYPIKKTPCTKAFTVDIKGPRHFYDVLCISTCLTLCWFIIDTRSLGPRQPYWHFKVQILEHQTLIKLSGQGYSQGSLFKYICSNNTFLITAMVPKLKLQNDDSPFP